MATIDWEGASGRTYTYHIYSLDTPFSPVAGNYAFAKETSPGWWRPLYFGQTDDLKDRITSTHHKWACAKRNGMTHIHAHQNPNQSARLDEEQDLIAKWAPVCND